MVTRGGTHNWLIWAWPHYLVLPMPVGRIRPGELSVVSPNTCRDCPVLRLPAWSRRDGMFHGREKFGLGSRAEHARCALVSGSRCRFGPAQSKDDGPGARRADPGQALRCRARLARAAKAPRITGAKHAHSSTVMRRLSSSAFIVQLASTASRPPSGRRFAMASPA